MPDKSCTYWTISRKFFSGVKKAVSVDTVVCLSMCADCEGRRQPSVVTHPFPVCRLPLSVSTLKIAQPYSLANEAVFLNFLENVALL